jgi:serpin B
MLCLLTFSLHVTASEEGDMMSGNQVPSKQVNAVDVPFGEKLKKFSINLYETVGATQKGNIVISPYSLFSALHLVYEGAHGNTATELSNTLHLGTAPQSDVTRQLQQLETANTSLLELSITNNLWGQKGISVTPKFATYAKEVDFQATPAQVLKEINGSVEKATHGKITNLLDSSMITQSTRFVLTNAVYFKGSWERPFDPKNTKEEKFSVSPEQNVNVPMMLQEGSFLYREMGGTQLIELPYKDAKQKPQISFVVILPAKSENVSTLIQQADSAGFKEQVVRLHLPKFKVAMGMEMKPILKKMGINDAFEPAKADFSGITGKQDELSISAITHKSLVEVDEKGTEAAAASSVVMSRGVGTQQPIIMQVNHPFYFMIRENKTGVILFLGRVVNPLR